jgi:hypothetical protein
VEPELTRYTTSCNAISNKSGDTRKESKYECHILTALPNHSPHVDVKLSLSKPRKQKGAVEVKLHSFLISAPDEGQHHTPVALLLGRNPSVYPLTRKLGALQHLGHEKSQLALLRFETCTFQPVG